MKKLIAIFLLGVLGAAGQGLTPAQKESDFRYLASLYAGLYGPREWKKQALGFDLLAIRPWLEKVARTETDLEFYEVCQEYIASLRDSHVTFTLPSTFAASLGFAVDIYDGSLLIDTIDRTRLPQARYPFVFGDELISIDGEDAKQALERMRNFLPQANESAWRRRAAALLTSRRQALVPRAALLESDATVVIRRQNGTEETYTIPWVKTGTPLEVGPVPSPRTRTAAEQRDPMEQLRDLRLPFVWDGVVGVGARNPIFVNGLPSTFMRRLGGTANDFFYSGVLRFEELRIGFIRIPTYSPPSQAQALAQFDAEIAFFKANTDGLIIDNMRNPGGNACFLEALVSRLMTREFRTLGYAMRPYWFLVPAFNATLLNAKAAGAPFADIAQHEANLEEMRQASREGRLTKPLPLCSSPALMLQPRRNAAGELTGYDKPIMVLNDEFSGSGGDAFPAILQDNAAAVIYGMRTNGAGGNVINLPAGTYSEASTRVTLSLMVRNGDVVTEDYPTAPFVENIGVRPEITVDYMTKDNLLNNGATFVRQFVEGMAAYIRQQQQR